jgi:hypothetical protein
MTMMTTTTPCRMGAVQVREYLLTLFDHILYYYIVLLDKYYILMVVKYGDQYFRIDVF